MRLTSNPLRSAAGSRSLVAAAAYFAGALLPRLAAAQSSPFLTGATALQSNILTWLTPIAVILVMVLGAMAMANRMSWGWCIGAIMGIAIAFGAPQIVTWVRGMFGV
ncbi:MAG: TrbC/VirB2 family protein [Steroidobacteraceae bacterium]